MNYLKPDHQVSWRAPSQLRYHMFLKSSATFTGNDRAVSNVEKKKKKTKTKKKQTNTC